MEAIKIVQDGHIEGCCDGTLLLVAPDVHVLVVSTAVRQPVNQPGVSVESKYDRLVFSEQRIEVLIAQPVRVFSTRLYPHQIDDIDYPNFQIGQMFAEDGN